VAILLLLLLLTVVVVVDVVSFHNDTVGFQNRIIESEQPTANNDPDAFQHTFLA
jgi:hypothetical protein